LLCPIVENDDNSSGCSDFRSRVLPDLVNKIERSVANCPNADADVDRLEVELAFEVTLGAGDDEADLSRAALAGEVEPEQRARPLEVGEKDGVVDVAEGIEIAEQDVVRNDVLAVTPLAAKFRRHASL